jgi:hypothetical protein
MSNSNISVSKLSDLTIGQTYWIIFFYPSAKHAKKCKFLGTENVHSNYPEINIRMYDSNATFYLNEIGIGTTKAEAKQNYGKFHPKITKEQAQDELYSMWENGIIPSNFTEDHSEYDRAVECLMYNGELVWEDFF